MSKINRDDVIGPLTAEQANHVWQILKDAGEVMYRSKPDYDFRSKNTFAFLTPSLDWGTSFTPPTISYEDFVAKMSAPNPKWLNTKWDVRNWTKEQKIAFQEECFRLGYSWSQSGKQIAYIGAKGYNIAKGKIFCWIDSMADFHKPFYGTEKYWEDMFPENAVEVPVSTPDHECWMYYNHTLDCCLKCHPERDLRNKSLWGILDTARREQEYIEEVRRGRK